MERTAAERERAASERGEQLLISVGFERAGMKRTFIQWVIVLRRGKKGYKIGVVMKHSYGVGWGACTSFHKVGV